MLSRASERALHLRLLGGDATAVNECCTVYIPAVQAQMRLKYRRDDFAHLLEEAVDTAVFDYVKHPWRYDPSRLSLTSYLRMAAWRDFLTLLEREQRHSRVFFPLPLVELWPDGRNDGWNDEPIDLPPGLTREQVLAELARLVPDPIDRMVIWLMVVDEVRDTAAFARVLGLEHLDAKQQEEAVKRTKDRLTKRLRRLGERLSAATSA